MEVGQCLHNMSHICSHGKYMNYICPYGNGSSKCYSYLPLTQEMIDSWNTKGCIAINPTPSMEDEEEHKRKSFMDKKVHSATLDLLAMKVTQEELREFDRFLKEQVELKLITQERYELLYDKAEKHSR